MGDDGVEAYIANRLVNLLGDKNVINKLIGTITDQRELLFPLIESALSETGISLYNQQNEIPAERQNNPENIIAHLTSKNNNDPEVTALLNKPILEFEIIVNSSEQFISKLNASTLLSKSSLIFPEGKASKCHSAECGSEVSPQDVSCPECQRPLHTYQKLPLVEGGIMRTSYNFLREILTWPEVVSINSRKKYHQL